MEQSKPGKKLVRPTYRIPEWSSRAEEEFICKDVGCSPARKENRDDLRGGRAMRWDRREKNVPGGLRHDRASGWEARTENLLERQICDFLARRGFISIRQHVGTFLPLRVVKQLQLGQISFEQAMRNIVRHWRRGASDW